jgi:hypothetical protein
MHQALALQELRVSFLSNIFGNRNVTQPAVPGAAQGIGASPVGRDGVPVALRNAAEAQKQAYRNPDGTERLVRYDNRDMPFGRTGERRLPAGSFGAELRRMSGSRDAGNATIVTDNADLHVLSYCYGTHKSMEAWLTNTPKDGQLKLNLIASPSTHAGSDAAEKTKNFEKFSRTNVYILEIEYPDRTRERVRFDVEGNSPPKYGNNNPAPRASYASPSPDITIDLNKWAGKGDIKIRGWAEGSAGVAGYQEKRETILHLG